MFHTVEHVMSPVSIESEIYVHSQKYLVHTVLNVMLQCLEASAISLRDWPHVMRYKSSHEMSATSHELLATCHDVGVTCHGYQPQVTRYWPHS